MALPCSLLCCMPIDSWRGTEHGAGGGNLLVHSTRNTLDTQLTPHGIPTTRNTFPIQLPTRNFLLTHGTHSTLINHSTQDTFHTELTPHSSCPTTISLHDTKKFLHTRSTARIPCPPNYWLRDVIPTRDNRSTLMNGGVPFDLFFPYNEYEWRVCCTGPCLWCAMLVS